ncbi:hypothetical protein GCM10009792_06530 [Microcella alkalica]
MLAIGAQGAVIAGAAWAAANPRIVADRVTVLTTDLDPVVAEYAVSAGMSEEGVDLLHASLTAIVPGDDFDDYCSTDEPGIGVLGCYTLDDGRIYLYDVENPDLAALEPIVAAHEMLHAAWDRLTADEQDALAPLLEEAFAALGPDHELVERIAAYEAQDPSSRIPELYAIIGSEIAAVPAALEVHYARYFDDRAASVALSERITALFADLEARLTALSDELEALGARIDAEQAAYDVDAAALEAEITAFNQRAAEPGGYTSQSVFLRDRDALVARQQDLNARLQATNALVAEYNALLEQLEALNAEADELNRSINVELVPIEERDAVDEPTGG